LPGVFVTQADPAPNGPLWTVPVELTCYALISAMIITKIIKNYFTLLTLVVLFLISPFIHFWTYPTTIAGLLGAAWVPYNGYNGREIQAELAFLIGIIVYQNRHVIPYNVLIFGCCVTALITEAVFLLKLVPSQTPIFLVLSIPILVYITVFIGLTPMPLPKFFKTGDYSYGIYLYHYPFLHIIISLFPAFALAHGTGAIFTFFTAVPLVLAVAWLSWHFIEKPLLALRRRFSVVAKLRGVESINHARPSAMV
jgi:peptidoglycan/LPS O-acetylase OafA/YrhL